MPASGVEPQASGVESQAFGVESQASHGWEAWRWDAQQWDQRQWEAQQWGPLQWESRRDVHGWVGYPTEAYWSDACWSETVVPQVSPSSAYIVAASHKSKGTTDYFAINKVIATADRSTLLPLLDHYRMTEQSLNIVNIATLLHKAGKLRMRLPDSVVAFVVASLERSENIFGRN